MINRRIIFASIIIIFIIIVIKLTYTLSLEEIISGDENLADNDIRIEKKNLINKEGLTIKDRYLPQEGYTRLEYEERSFAEFLRNQKLKSYGEKVLY